MSIVTAKPHLNILLCKYQFTGFSHWMFPQISQWIAPPQSITLCSCFLWHVDKNFKPWKKVVWEVHGIVINASTQRLLSRGLHVQIMQTFLAVVQMVVQKQTGLLWKHQKQTYTQWILSPYFLPLDTSPQKIKAVWWWCNEMVAIHAHFEATLVGNGNFCWIAFALCCTSADFYYWGFLKYIN